MKLASRSCSIVLFVLVTTITISLGRGFISSSLFAKNKIDRCNEVDQLTRRRIWPSDQDVDNEQNEQSHGHGHYFQHFSQLHIPARFIPGAHQQREHQHELLRLQHHEQQHHDQQQHHHHHHHHHHGNPVSSFFSQLLPNDNDPQSKLVSKTPEWRRLSRHAEVIKNTHLRDLLKDERRCDSMYATHDGLYVDYSRQRATKETMDLLLDLARARNLEERIDGMRRGEKINFTENRAVLHAALRSPEGSPPIFVDGEDVVPQIRSVLDEIRRFTNAVRNGEIVGYTGKRLRNIVSVGIGGSYLGPEFLHEVLKTEHEGINSSLGYSLHFLSNVDPVDVERTCAGLNPEETLVVVVSKTFSTAETMLNAKTMRQWLWDFMGNDKEVVRKHFVACASISSKDKVEDFGINTDGYFFRFWDWVGGRYSVCSAAGAVPISLLYGYDLFEKFLLGARSIDDHFFNTPLKDNIPVIMGLLGVWNMSFLKYNTRALHPYAEALLKFPAHVQQLDMESNGKSVTKDGVKVDYPVGEVDFGEPGTNGQHSFFQLLHMGQTVPCEFIGFAKSQHDLRVDGEDLSSHDELMANFFAQPDALANGKTAEEVRREGNTPESLIVHKTFEGNRPSTSLLLPRLTAYAAGQLLATYEHRTVVQGFLWDINSFDQWGVELGKKLAIDVKERIRDYRNDPSRASVDIKGSPATSRILNYYLDAGSEDEEEEEEDLDHDYGRTGTSVTRLTYMSELQTFRLFDG